MFVSLSIPLFATAPCRTGRNENISASGKLEVDCVATKSRGWGGSEIQSGLIPGSGPGMSMCYKCNTSLKSSW